MRIYSYYQSIPSINQDEQFACANLWKESWSKNGWEPVMLNRTHAQVSLKYNKMLQKIVSELRHVEALRNDFDLITARLVRWCALHASGGGWMSDYDTLNLGFLPEDAQKRSGSILVSPGKAFVFYVSQEACTQVINKFLSEDLVSESQFRNECDILEVDPFCALGGIYHPDGKIGQKSKLMAESWALWNQPK